MKPKSTLISTIILIAAVMVSTIAIAQSRTVKLADSWGQQGITLQKQSNSGLQLNFSVEDYVTTPITLDREELTAITMTGVILQNSEGAPNLPAFSKYIAVPKGAAVKVNIINKRTENVGGLKIAPAPRIPKDDDLSPLHYAKNQDIYTKNAFYPEQSIEVSSPRQIRGLDVVLISVSPFQYNPVTGELILHRDLEIEVTFEGGNGQFGDDRLRSRWWDPIMRDAVINQASVPAFEPKVRAAREVGSEYVIIVPNDPAFLAWADTIRIFRQRQGITTAIYTTDAIGGNTTGAIETFINDAYYNWDMPPAAVLLIGDYGTSGNTITSPIWDNYCISDNFYADVDGDDLPDVVLARMTAQNEDQLEVMVTKFLHYERNPPTNPGFYSNPITAMGWQTERWFQICSEVIAGFFENELGKTPVRENAIYSGSTSGGWSTATNTSTVLSYFGPDGLGYIPATPTYLTDWGGNATRVNNDINSGAFLLQHRDHGMETGWGEPSYTNSDINGLTNTDLTFIFSINCLTGKFNWSNECFAEKFHRYTYNGNNSGALGITAATEVSYSFVNDTYVWGLYDNMWPDFMPDYGTTPDSRGLFPAFGNAAGKHFLEQSSWPYNTSNKEVTYYLFHHHGDAFSTMYSEVPQNLNVVHNNVQLGGIDFFTIEVDAGALVCLTVNNEIIGLAEGTGQQMDIPIVPQIPGTIIDLVITKQNYYRYETPIGVIPPDGAYCLYASHTAVDTLGNGNNKVEFGEEIFIDLEMKNLGNENGVNIAVELASDQYVTFIDSTEIYDTIYANGTALVAGGYKVLISDGIPDQHKLQFDIAATDEADSTWTSKFNITVNAPNINPVNMTIDDSEGGNNNGRLDPGETANMVVKMANNGHCVIHDVVCTMIPYNSYVTVNTPPQTIPTLGLFGSTNIIYNVTVANDAPNAVIAEMHYNASAAGYSIDRTYYPKIGIFVEDFETGTFTHFNWQQAGNLPWTVNNQYPYEGFFQAKSGAIGDNQTTEFSITYTVMEQDSVKFWRKISSEPDFDKLIFKIDNNIKGTWSGSKSWAQEAFAVSSGTHTFTWIYSKDFSGTSGSDCAWVDYIELPTMMVSTVFAGPDDESCANAEYQCEGSATNFSSLLWTTSGDGTFNMDNVFNPLYTPGENDIATGVAVLTLSMVDVSGNPFTDMMTLTLSNGPASPEMPVGPDYVDVYQITQTQYNTTSVQGASAYVWTLAPEEAGTITNLGLVAIIDWNPDFMGDVLLTVSAVDMCGAGEPSEALAIFVDNTVGLNSQNGKDLILQVSPNPNNGAFAVNVKTNNENEELSLKLLNYLGVELISKTHLPATGFNLYFDNNELSAGLYILKIEQGNQTYSRKVLITK